VTAPSESPPVPVYLDYNATTPLDPAVIEAMGPFLGRDFGNPSSAHRFGQVAREALEAARAQVAGLLGAEPGEVVFTGSGSEATNLALKGLAFAAGAPFEKVSIVTSAVEHPATLEACRFLQGLGCRLTVVPVDRYGVVDLGALAAALGHGATVVSVMHANNEVGTIEPVAEVSELAHAHGALLHVDAAQSVGKVGVDVRELGADLLTLAGHKLYAPKGTGALYVREGVRLEPLVHGGGQERGRRSGTENVAYAVALGTACEVARRSLPGATARLASLSGRLWQHIEEALGDAVVLNGHPTQRLPNTLNVSFLGHSGADLLARVPEVAASTGSACHDGTSASPVLGAMGLPADVTRGAVRLSVGRPTTESEVDLAAGLLASRSRTAT
jgi:cysteine desulfurase